MTLPHLNITQLPLLHGIPRTSGSPPTCLAPYFPRPACPVSPLECATQTKSYGRLPCTNGALAAGRSRDVTHFDTWTGCTAATACCAPGCAPGGCHARGCVTGCAASDAPPAPACLCCETCCVAAASAPGRASAPGPARPSAHAHLANRCRPAPYDRSGAPAPLAARGLGPPAASARGCGCAAAPCSCCAAAEAAPLG